MLLGLVGAVLAQPAVDPDVFKTKAAFSVDDRGASLSTAIATVEPRTGATGYSWLRINFYGFAPDAADIAAAVKGNIRSMEAKFNKLTANPSRYNTSWPPQSGR